MKSKMMKRYEDGGILEAANQSEDSQDIASSMGAGERNTDEPEYKSFKEAYNAEKKLGKKTFEYMGKKHTIDTIAPRKEAAKAAAPKAESAPAPKEAAPTDVTKMSLSERAKASRESARSGSGSTDRRSVGERLRTAMAGKDRGGNTVDFAGTGMGMNMGGAVAYANGGVVKRAVVKSHGKAC
jgi:hypothetical protein